MTRYMDDSESCGPKCRGARRRPYCTYGDPCGASDCSTCHGAGIDHDGCDEPVCDSEQCLHCDDGNDADCACACHDTGEIVAKTSHLGD